MRRCSALAAVLTAVFMTSGCDLDVQNPNAPDANRAFGDPAGLQQLLGGAFRTWVEARDGYYVMPLTTMADNYTASWNNAAIRFYSSVGADCASRCGWTNSPTASDAGLAVEAQYYGYYTVWFAATHVLDAMQEGICFDDDCTALTDYHRGTPGSDSTITVRNKAIAQMLQGMAFAGIAVMYDSGFVVDENTTLPENPAAYPPFNSRTEMRVAALQKFAAAYTTAGLDTAVGIDPWETEAEWMGVDGGTAYTNTQIRQVIRTMQAEVIAMWPRNGVENAAADWAAVATYASQGVSSGADPFDWEFNIDISARDAGIEYVKSWGNSILTMRVDTRVAAMITTNHVDPWPAGGNPCPTTSPDLRVGDGTYGTADNPDYGTSADTGLAGTDYACSGIAIFPAARGQYHQSNLQHVRYHHLGGVGEALPGDNGTGADPFYTTQMNDLLWAEGLIRSGGNPVQAANLINNSRVGRGGLPALTGSETVAQLLTALQYEQEIEFMGQGATAFFNRRRIDGLITGTPRQMPVPAKELNVLLRATYTFGGNKPDMVAGVGAGAGMHRPTVADRWRELQAMKPRPGFLSSRLFAPCFVRGSAPSPRLAPTSATPPARDHRATGSTAPSPRRHVPALAPHRSATSTPSPPAPLAPARPGRRSAAAIARRRPSDFQPARRGARAALEPRPCSGIAGSGRRSG
jgi:hypothetical protein